MQTNEIEKLKSENSALRQALEGLETAFDRWYCESGHLCALMDGTKSKPTPEMVDETLRLQNLIVKSIQARNLLKTIAK